MSVRLHHLPDDRLFECYVAERGGEPIDPPAADHLADCADCGVRYEELARFMDGVRSEVDGELDDVFPPDWQEAQRHQIARRLAHIGRAARVISFPRHFVDRHMGGRTPRVAPRWAAAAAAAGLFVGVAVGMFYDARQSVPSTAALEVSRPVTVAAQTPVSAASAPAPFDTDAFLEELEGALGGPRTPELMSLDVLTPHVRDIVLTSR